MAQQLQQTVVQDSDHIPPLALVPEAPHYINRKVGGVSDFGVFDYAFNTGQNVLLEGPTGPGKTTAVIAWAALREKPFYAIPSNVGVEPSQLYGKFAPDGKGGFVWVDGPVTYIGRYGGALLVNEVNFMPDRVATATYSLLDSRRELTLLDHHGEVIRLHRPPHPDTGAKCWCSLPEDECKRRWVLIVADMNPDYEGTRPLNKAFRNRFEIQLVWDYDDIVESKLISSEPLREFMQSLRSAAAAEVYSTPVSTNMGMEFERIALSLGYDFAVHNFVNHFGIEERESIVKLFEGARDNIEPTIAVKVETPEEEFDRRMKMRIGDVDYELGVYGTEWVWTENEDDPAPNQTVEVQA
jgi:hypothetical protein